MIPNPSWPLRYKISDWSQLPGAESNNSRDLHIRVTKFIHDSRISGTRISVEHDDYGVLFSTVVGVDGRLVTRMADEGGYIYQMTPDQILMELTKWGFLIDYEPTEALPGELLSFLMTLQGLHYDKIRIMSVYEYVNGIKKFKWYTVAFKIDPLGDWMNSGYSASLKEFHQALESGNAINVTAISDAKNYDWSWLYNWVGDINDILEQNA